MVSTRSNIKAKGVIQKAVTKKFETNTVKKKVVKKKGKAVLEVRVISGSISAEYPHGTLDRHHEQDVWQQGHQLVAGVDEAGRGPLAGPVVAASCILPKHITIAGIHDSKLLNLQQREKLYTQLTTNPEIIWSVHEVDNYRIDDINILQAAMEAMSKSLDKLKVKADYALIDGNRLPDPLPSHLKGKAHWIIKGDAQCYAIAAASIIAKVHRDRIMLAYDKQYPEYNFAQHKGYPVFAHKQAVSRHGPCPIHRLTFRPLKGKYTKADMSQNTKKTMNEEEVLPLKRASRRK